jgi:alkylation response protein AidB-like acyl-CoA dehydrogenase
MNMDDSSRELAAVATKFVQTDVLPYLAVPGNEDQYPKELIAKMASLGFFGMNIPPEYEGLGLERGTMNDIDLELGRGWLSLGALLGSHLRACFYFLKRGTEEQRQHYLPLMAKGELIVAHAYHEQGNKNLKHFKTTLIKEGDTYVLNGIKDWVTNARHANFIIAIARNELHGSQGDPVAVIVHPERPGVHIGKELQRPGVKGVSLCSVQFTDYVVDLEQDLIGGLNADIVGFINTFKTGSSLNFSARAVGAALAVQEHCKTFLEARDMSSNGGEIIRYKFAIMATRVQAAMALLSSTKTSNGVPADSLAYMTKVFSTTVLQDTIRDAMMLMGGGGYASGTGSLDRIYRDAASLLLIDTPNDILLSRIGGILLAAPEG